jgi:hypothetical protein
MSTLKWLEQVDYGNLKVSATFSEHATKNDNVTEGFSLPFGHSVV